MSLRRSVVRRIAAVAALAVASVITPLAGTAPHSAAEAPLSMSELHSPAVVSFVDGRLDVFWTAPTGGLRQRFLQDGGSWSRVVTRGGSLASQPAAVSWGPGRVDVFARGADNRLKWRTRTSTGWSAWRSLGGSLGSAPAVTSWAPGRLDVFVRWSDGRLYQRTLVGGVWRTWAPRGGTLTSSPSAATWRKGRIDVVARTTGHELVHRVYTLSDGWSRWRNVGGEAAGQPALVSAAPRRLDMFYRDSGYNMRRRSFVVGEGWSASKLVGHQVFGSGPGATVIGGEVVLMARLYTQFYRTSRPSLTAAWRPWRLIDPVFTFRRLGTWVDVLDYRDPDLVPAPAVADMKARGVRTLFLGTARFDSADDFYDEEAMAAWLDAAHAEGLRVVGWYVPGYGDMARDIRRVVAIDDYVSPAGQRFDAIGVDIERFGTSGEVDLDAFNDLVVPHLEAVRAKTSAILAAIVPSPYATDPGNNWEGFPWAGIGPNSDVVVPMALWSFRSNPDGSAYTADQVEAWVLDQIVRARTLTGRDVHVEGGVDDPGTEATPVTTDRVAAFVRATVGDVGAMGGSHYDYATTAEDLWPVLAGINP